MKPHLSVARTYASCAEVAETSYHPGRRKDPDGTAAADSQQRLAGTTRRSDIADHAPYASRGDAHDMVDHGLGLLERHSRLGGGEDAERLAEVGAAHGQDRVRLQLGAEVDEGPPVRQRVRVALLTLQDDHPSVLGHQPGEGGRLRAVRPGVD